MLVFIAFISFVLAIKDCRQEIFNIIEGSVYDDVGIKQSLTQAGLNQCVDLVAPIVVNAFNTITVPDITINVSSYVFSLYDIVASDFDLSGIFATLVDGVGIAGGCEHTSLNVGMSFSFYQNGWPYASGKGSITVIVSNLDLSGVASFYLDENHKEHIKMETVSVVLKDMDIHIEIDGSSGSLINTIVQLLNPVIVDLVETSFENIVAQAVETVISEGMESPSYYELENGVILDVRELQSPEVTYNALTTGVVGAYGASTDLPDYYDDFDPVEMPSYKGKAGIQLFVSYENVEYFWKTFIKTGYFDNVEADVDVSKYLKKVGNVKIKSNISEYKDFKPLFTGFYLEIDGTSIFSVYNEDGFLINTLEASYSFGIAQQPYLPHSDVTDTQIVGMKFYYHSTNSWNLEGGDGSEEENSYYSMLLWVNCLQPYLNNWGKNNGYPVVVFNTMYLSNPEIEFGDGYFYIGGDLTPPQ